MSSENVAFQERSPAPKNGHPAQAGKSEPSRHKASFKELANIALDALHFNPPLYVSSILGLPWTWIPPYHTYSEFRIADIFQLRRMAQYLFNIGFPSIPYTPPDFGSSFINNFFWRPSVLLQRPDHNGSYTSYPEEAWFFVNGIMTNDAMAQINAAYISYLFHRPVTLIQNSTNSFFFDLLQCSLGKEWAHTTEEAIKAFPPIYDALRSEKKKVVVIAHSQGTIVMSIVLRLLTEITQPDQAAETLAAEAAFAGPQFIYPEGEILALTDFEPLKESELEKLEIYCFANCANTMEYFPHPEGSQKRIPWIENYGNEYDLVARLGMLAPDPKQWAIEIDGPQYLRPRAWGHLLNEHYLRPIEESQKSGRKRGGKGGTAPFTLMDAGAVPGAQEPRLYSYINGGQPA